MTHPNPDARRSPQPDDAADRAAVPRRGGVRRAGGRASGSSRSRSTRSSTRWRRTTTRAGCRCRRRAACCSIATARSSSRTRTPSTSRWSASRPRQPRRDAARPRARRPASTKRSCSETVNRRRREPSYRPIVLIENATLEQVIAVTARQLELPGIDLPGSAVAASIRRATWRRTCSATSARSPRRSWQRADYSGRRAGRDRRPGRRRAGLQQAADGHRRQPGASSSTASAARSARRRASSRRRKAGACS